MKNRTKSIKGTSKISIPNTIVPESCFNCGLYTNKVFCNKCIKLCKQCNKEKSIVDYNNELCIHCDK